MCWHKASGAGLEPERLFASGVGRAGKWRRPPPAVGFGFHAQICLFELPDLVRAEKFPSKLKVLFDAAAGGVVIHPIAPAQIVFIVLSLN